MFRSWPCVAYAILNAERKKPGSPLSRDERDHTYDEVGSDGPVHGTWALQDGKICTTADRSLGDDRLTTYCNAALGKHVGDNWRDADPVTGNVVFFPLVARSETQR